MLITTKQTYTKNIFLSFPYYKDVEMRSNAIAVLWLILCQLDWAKGCPDIWLNIILGICVRVLLGEINICQQAEESRCLPLFRWVSSKGLEI